MERVFPICIGAIFYIGGPLLLVMGLYYFYLAIRNPGRSKEAKEWPTAEGKIADIHLIGRKSWMNNIELRYLYTVNGIEYTGRNLTLFPNTIFGKERLDEILNKYHTGQYLPVYYNPEKPKEAILEPDLGEQDRWFLIWSIVNVIVGVFLAAVIIFNLVEGG